MWHEVYIFLCESAQVKSVLADYSVYYSKTFVGTVPENGKRNEMTQHHCKHFEIISEENRKKCKYL